MGATRDRFASACQMRAQLLSHCAEVRMTVEAALRPPCVAHARGGTRVNANRFTAGGRGGPGAAARPPGPAAGGAGRQAQAPLRD